MRALGLVASLLFAASACVAGARPHVYLVVVDGLGADAAGATLMPRLAELGRVGVRAEARAVMPTRTNPNHASLLTGLLPASHGITGNGYWDRVTGASRALDGAGLLEAETLFTVIETTKPQLVTVAAFSKAKLGRLLAAAPGRQRAPDVAWSPPADGLVGHVIGVASDAETMDAFLAATVDREPDLAVVNLSEVDRTAHAQGPGATADARRHADAAIGRLVDDLRARGRWADALVVVTADHGFDDVAPTPEHPDASVALGARFAAEVLTGVHVVGDGGVAHVYADGVAADATAVGEPAATRLGWAAAIAWREPGVAEVLARLPLPGVPSLDGAHPTWGLAHERAGDLLVVANPGVQLVDDHDGITLAFRGNHGSPRESRVPLVLAGGALDAAKVAFDAPPSAADVGATIGALLGVRTPRRFDGRPVLAGRPVPVPLTDGPTARTD